MEVSLEIYNWLREVSLVSSETEPQENGRCLIDEETAGLLENGLNFTPLIKRLNRIKNKLDREVTPMPEINSLKEVKSAATKLYNWKILTTALDMLGIKIDADTRSLIVAGDRDMVVEILTQIYNAELSAEQSLELQELQDFEKDSQASKKLNISVDSSVPRKKQTTSRVKPKSIDKSASIKNNKKKPDGTLYIESIRADKSLDSADSCLEFLLISFCKNFSLRPKQAAGLLTQGGKYLAYIISKGLKGKFNPIISWYQEIYANISHLLKLVSNEEASGSVPLMLASLKSGFNSKNIETVLWCCRVFSKMGSELYEQDLLPPAWDWFVVEGGGLEGCLQACKRFGAEVKSQVVSVLVQFARNNFYELFTIQMRNYLMENVSYLSTMNEFLQCFSEIRAAKQELATAGIIEYWLEMGIRLADNESSETVDVRLSGVNFICDIWMEYPGVIENREMFAGDIITVLKKGWKDRLKILKMGCIGKAFQLLEVFTVERNPFAPIIYKTLTFYLVESYNDQLAREFIMHNFNYLFERMLNIPVGIVLEPLVKQLQIRTDLEYNTIDFDFFIRIAKHPRLTMKNAIQAMDALGKIYMNDKNFSKSAAIPFMMIASRFIEGSSIREYLYRFVKYSLKLTNSMETNKSREKSKHESDQNKKLQRDLMLDLSQKIIKLRHESLNDRLVKEICETNFQIRQSTGSNSKAILVLLRLLGDPRELIDIYTEQRIENHEEEEENTVEEPEENIRPAPEKNNVRLKKERFTTESSTTSLNSMNLLPRGRAQLEIERIRQNLIEKELEAKLKAEKSQKTVENRKRVLRKQVEKRRIELGVPSKVDPSELDEQKPSSLVMLHETSPQDKEMVAVVLKRYLRVLKLLFKKYSSTGYNRSVVNQESFAEKNSLLSDPEFYKLLKEQGITSSMLPLEEFSTLIKTYCHRQKKTQIKVNFQEFQEVLVQAAIIIFSKPPKNYSNISPAVAVKMIFDQFRRSSAEKGISTKFYDEPDPGVGDREIVKRLNVLLENDPNTPLPEGFKKVVEKDIELIYAVPTNMGIGEGKAIALGILDEILDKKIGIHILPPMISIKSVTRARGILSKPQVSAENDLSLSLGTKFNISQMGITYHKAVYQPAQPIQLNFTPGIKFEIARLTGKYPNDLLYEAAKLVDDLINSVDIGSASLVSRNDKQKIVNKAQITKEKNISQKKIEEEEKEKKRRLRRQVIEEKLLKAKANKDNKIKEESEKKKTEEAKKKEILKRNEERKKEEDEKKEIEIKEWKKKKQEESEKAKQDSIRKKQLHEENLKKKLEEFKAKEKIKSSKLLEEQQEKNKSESKTNEIINEKKEKSKSEKKKQLEKVFLQDKTRKEEMQQNEEKIKSLKQNEGIQQTFSNMHKSLELLFSHYCKSIAVKDGSQGTQLLLVGFNKFCTQFNISPGLLSIDDCLKVFRAITKSKPVVAGAGISLDEGEFEESILRLSLISKEELEKDLSITFANDDEVLKGFFEYLNVNTEAKRTRDILQNIEIKTNNVHPRDKKRMKNQLNKSVNPDITSSRQSIRSKSSGKRILRPEKLIVSTNNN